MDNIIRTGIVGMGKMGQLRRDLINAHPEFTLAGICDTARRPGDIPDDCAFFHDYRSLIESDVDAIFVSTPNSITPEVVIAALDAGKHVFCEKPPGRSVKDIRAIIDAERQNPDLILKFGFNHRYHGAVHDAKSLIESGALGEIMWMRGVYGKAGGLDFAQQWRSNRDIAGGGILLDQGIHMLDLFNFFVGVFTQVKSYVTTSFWNIDLEDNAFALLKNDRNQIAMLHSSSTQWRHLFRLEIYLDGGYSEIHGILSSTRSYGQGERLITAKRQFEDEAKALGNPEEVITHYDRDLSWELEVQEFADAIIHDSPVIHGTSTDALRVMELVDAIYRDGERESAPVIQHHQVV